MKRFHCTICSRMKRVRLLPDSVRPIYDGARIIGYTPGVCRWHERGDGVSRAAINHRVRAMHTRRHKTAATAPVTKAKKGSRA